MPPLTRQLTEQQRNLWILAGIGVGLLSLVFLAVVALYLGYELPPAEMRTYYTSPTGYAAPPQRGVVPPGSVPRGALTLPSASEELPDPGLDPTRSRSPAPAPNLPESAGAGHAAVPPGAERLRNPLTRDPATLEFGRRQYLINCAMCHGEVGQPIGPVGERYIPRPPNLAEHVPGHSEGYLYYTITAGIRSVPTQEAAQYLPEEWHSFRGRTSAQERWAIVAYLKAATQAGTP